MIPHWSHFFVNPIVYLRTWGEVLKLQTAHTSAETAERRRHKVEDVSKRAEYRKAHGLDKNEGFGGWTAKSDGQLLGPAIPLGEAEDAETGQDQEGSQAVEQKVKQKRPPVKKWLGIW